MASRKLLTILLLACSLALPAQLTFEVPDGASSFTGEDWLAGVRGRLERLMNEPLLNTSQAALMVYDLNTAQMVFAHNERQRMWPAQSLQLITAVSALDLLGADYSFHTSICHSGRMAGDTLRGNLYCVGGFDPTLTRDDLRAMADSIRRFGIRRIEGMVVADVTMKDTLSRGSGWCWDVNYERLTPLIVDRKDEFVGRLAREMLNAGIELDVTWARSKVPQGCTEICRRSTAIGQVLKPMLKGADRLYAEAMFYQLAKANTTKEAKATDAVRAIKRLIGRLGLDDANYTIADGSGTSLYSYVTAELLVRFLRHAADNQWMLNAVYPSLSVAGVDGKLQGRLTSKPCRGNVHAVAGGMPGVSSLAGYCRASNGHILCFAIINQGLTQLRDGEFFQDRVCQVLCR